MTEFARQTRERAAPAYQPARSPPVHAERGARGELHRAAQLGFSLGKMSINPKVQAKLTVGPVNDHYEQEADRVAEQAVSMPEPPSLQRQAEDEEEELQAKPLAEGITPIAQRQVGEAEEENLQSKPLADGLTPLVQRQPEADEEELMQGKFASGLTGTLQAKEEAQNNTGMPDQLKSSIESLSGMDLSGVRVHYNSSKPKQLNALAYTQGHEIHVAPGQEQHLPHEVWHVVQQAQGRVKPTMRMRGVAINDDVALETEANGMGGRASMEGYLCTSSQTFHNLTGTAKIPLYWHQISRPEVEGSMNSPSSAPIQAMWIIRDGKRVLVKDDYQLKEGESLAPELSEVTPTGHDMASLETMPQPIMERIMSSLSRRDIAGLSGVSKGIRNTVIDASFSMAQGKIVAAMHEYDRLKGLMGIPGQDRHNGIMSILDYVEHLIYSWFSDNGTRANKEQRKYMFQMLDVVASHHQDAVAEAVEKNYQLWVKDKDSLKPDEIREINEIWSEITQQPEGTHFYMPTRKTIQHAENSEGVPRQELDLPPDFLKIAAKESNAQFARILSRPKGRQLLRKIKELGGMEITIPDTYYLTNPENAQPSGYGGPAEHPIGDGRYEIAIPPGLKDSDMSDFDKQGNRIPSPTFVGIAHEGTHVAHDKSGRSIVQDTLGEIGSQLLPQAYRDNPVNLALQGPFEEYRTIHDRQAIIVDLTQKISEAKNEDEAKKLQSILELIIRDEEIPNEADIRREHGLPLRVGHASGVTPEMHGSEFSATRPDYEYITKPRELALEYFNEQGVPLYYLHEAEKRAKKSRCAIM